MDEEKRYALKRKLWGLLKSLFAKPYQLSLLIGFGLHFVIQVSTWIFSETDHLTTISLEMGDNPLAAVIRLLIPFSMPLWIAKISRHIIAEQETKILDTFPTLNPQPVLEIDTDNRITYINPAGKRLLDPLLNDSENIIRLLGSHPFNDTKSKLVDGEFPPRIVSIENSVLLWNGSIHADSEKMNFFATDISSLKKAQIEMIDARNEAENANRLKSIFMANMSHEVRTPLNIIVGFTQLLEHSLSKTLGEEEKGYISKIYEGSDRLQHTVHEILEISLIEAGIYNKKPHVLHFQKLVEEISQGFESAAQAKNLSIKLDTVITKDLVKLDI